MSTKPRHKRITGISITIESSDDAMMHAPFYEIASALEQIVSSVNRQIVPGDVDTEDRIVFDTNGNRIGRWRYSKEK
jgi:hypothetical protein